MSDFDDILGADPLPVDPRSEKAIQNSTLVDLSAIQDSIFWRHNTGQAWQGQRVRARTGQTITVERNMVILRNARPIDFGLPGSGDIIGAVGGVPCSVEIKTTIGRQSETQGRFETAWSKAGGIYVLARSPADAVTQVKNRIRSRNGT